MKIQATSEALKRAMSKATTIFHSPSSRKETAAVVAVSTINAAQTATNVPTLGMCTCSLMTVSNQIQQGEKENPNDIHEMPVEANHLDGGEIMRMVSFANRLD